MRHETSIILSLLQKCGIKPRREEDYYIVISISFSCPPVKRPYFPRKHRVSLHFMCNCSLLCCRDTTTTPQDNKVLPQTHCPPQSVVLSQRKERKFNLQ